MTRICFVLIDRANYGRLKPLMRAFDADPDFELQIVCGGSMVLERFGCAFRTVACDFPGVPNKTFFCETEGGNELTMMDSAGRACSESANILARNPPDVVCLIGDRYQAVGVAMAAVGLRIPLLHLQGGEVSGTLDNTWRRMITQAATWHVPATQWAAEQILKQRQSVAFDVDDSIMILTVGCPSSDIARTIERRERSGILAIYHPDTASDDDGVAEMEAILAACADTMERPCTVLWPNIDAGSHPITLEIKRWRSMAPVSFEIRKNLPPEEFYDLLANVKVCVGNSSSFVRDAGFFGTPVVLVGSRQDGRECGENVSYLNAGSCSLSDEIQYQMRMFYEPSTLYGDGHVCPRIVESLKERLQLSVEFNGKKDYIEVPS